MPDTRRLRIEVGAAINASFNSVLRAVSAAQKQAAREAAQEQKKAAEEAKQAVKRSIQEQQAALKSLDAWQKKALKDRTAAEKLASKEAASEAKKKANEMRRIEEDVNRTVRQQLAERRRLERQAMAEVERDLREHNRRRKQEEAAAGGGGGRGGGGNRSHLGFGSRFGSTLALRAASAAIHVPTRIAGDILRGAGVNYGLEDQISGYVGRQSLAATISNQAYIPSAQGTAAATRVDPNVIMKEAANTAIATGTDTQEVLAGMSKFVSHTGDLQTFRETMTDLAKLTKANGANFEEMATAVAEVSNEMGDIPNKGIAINSVLRSLAGQGQLTSIELKDQARSLAMVASQARFFKIDPMSAATLSGQGVTNDVGQKIAVVNALAEQARSKGGRTTSKMAMQSAQAFIEDLSNPNQVKRWHGAGMEVYADAGHTQVRDPLQILLEAFRKGRGKGGVNLDSLNNLFPNKRSRAVAKAFAQDYNIAYEEAARKGVTDELKRHQYASEQVTEGFQKILRTTQSMEQVDKSFQLSMKTAESQVKVFNAQISKTSDELMAKLLPALLKLAPLFSKFADFIVDKLGIKADEASKNAFTTQANALNAASVANQLTEIDPKTGKMRGGKISTKTEGNLQQAKTDLEAELAKARADLTKHGKERYGLLGGKNYEDLSDEEIRAQSEKTLFGDQKGEQFIQERERVKELKDSLDKLSTSIDKLDVAKQFGAVTTEPTPVIIKEDHSKMPGVKPRASGVADADSSTE